MVKDNPLDLENIKERQMKMTNSHSQQLDIQLDSHKRINDVEDILCYTNLVTMQPIGELHYLKI
jgi:hypothetical protein